MKKSKLAAVVLAAMVAMNPIIASAITNPPGGGGSSSGGVHGATAWWILICPGDVVAAAIAKNWKRHKELTQQEAWTCGLLYWWNEATGKYERRP